MSGGVRERWNRAETVDPDSAAVSLVGRRKKTSGLHRYCHLPLYSMMRAFSSSFVKWAGRVHDSSSTGGSTIEPSGHRAVSNLYRTLLSSTKEELLIIVTWPSNQTCPTVFFRINDDWSSQVLRETKGTQSLVVSGNSVDIYWDLSSVKYSSGAGNMKRFYIGVVVDRELALLLGDKSRQLVEQLEGKGRRIPYAECSLVSRREQVVGIESHTTWVLLPDGSVRDVRIKCKGGLARESELSVWIEERRVANVRRLDYNFRGNRTVDVDGWPVELAWDLHGWWFSGGPRDRAVFAFRTGSTLENRLWLEEDEGNKSALFSLVVEAYKNLMDMDDDCL